MCFSTVERVEVDIYLGTAEREEVYIYDGKLKELTQIYM